jgi:hypothetical protein
MTALREDFDVVADGDESRNQSSTFIVNGRVTQQSSFSHVYHFRLTPKRTGRLTIASPEAMVDGKQLSATSLPLLVVAPEEQDLVVPEIMLDRSQVYPTQPFEVALRVLVRPLPDTSEIDPVTPLRRQPPQLSVNWVDPPPGLNAGEKTKWLEPLLSDNGGGFTLNDVTVRTGSIFDSRRLAVFNLYQGRETREGLDGEKIEYFAYELKRTFTSEKAGTYQFGPVLVKGTFVDGIESRSYSARRLVAVAPAVAIEVREVPTPRPDTYCGGIGRYEVDAVAQPTELRVGDPLTLTLEFRRGADSGSLELISPPRLDANQQLAADFDIIDKSPTGQTAGDVKRFTYAIRPKRAGAQLPPLAITVFDPESESFSELTTRPIALNVAEAGRLGSGDLVGTLPGTSGQEIKSRDQGIFQNITDSTQISDQRVDVAKSATWTAGIWCAVGCLVVGLTTYRRKSGEAGWRRRQQARRAAHRRLADARAAVTQARAQDAMLAVRAAVLGLIADMRNIVAEGLTASEADAVLAAGAVDAQQRAAVLKLLESIERAEYGSGQPMELTSTIETAEDLIARLARALDRG